MAKLVCEDCGEVLEEDLSEQEAQDAKDSIGAEDHTHESDNDPSESDDEADSGLDERQDPAEIEDQVEQEFGDKLDEIEDDSNIEDAADDVSDYEDAADEENMDLKVEVGNGAGSPGNRWDNCKEDGQRLADVFRDQLRQKQKNKTHRERRSGRFDSQRMVQAERGSAKVFKREDEGRDLEYETYFVLDRSYSMKGTNMKAAENAVATLMVALEKAGVKTELLDFYDDDPRVIKTLSQDVVEEKSNILKGRGAVDGNTPLGAVMNVLQGRIEGTHGKPFVVVVTDGKPNSEYVYMDALEKMDAPVLGVTIGRSGLNASKKDRLFNFHVTVHNTRDLTDKMYDLASGVML
jgi:uncharacterized protein YegL